MPSHSRLHQSATRRPGRFNTRRRLSREQNGRESARLRVSSASVPYSTSLAVLEVRHCRRRLITRRLTFELCVDIRSPYSRRSLSNCRIAVRLSPTSVRSGSGATPLRHGSAPCTGAHSPRPALPVRAQLISTFHQLARAALGSAPARKQCLHHCGVRVVARKCERRHTVFVRRTRVGASLKQPLADVEVVR